MQHTRWSMIYVAGLALLLSSARASADNPDTNGSASADSCTSDTSGSTTGNPSRDAATQASKGQAHSGPAEGQVKSVDRTSNQLKLSDGTQLQLDPNAKVTKDGQPASIGDIEAGDDVRAGYTPGSTVQQITATSRSGK